MSELRPPTGRRSMAAGRASELNGHHRHSSLNTNLRVPGVSKAAGMEGLPGSLPAMVSVPSSIRYIAFAVLPTYWGAAHSVITATSCLGIVSSRRMKDALYHSLVSAPWNSRFAPERTRVGKPFAVAPVSWPFHVPWSATESGLEDFEHPDATTSITTNVNLSISVILFIYFAFAYVLTKSATNRHTQNRQRCWLNSAVPDVRCQPRK
jgi:hypothetical protein